MYGSFVAPTISDTRREASHGPTLGDMFALMDYVGADDGELPAYAWPGGYPILYLSRGDVLCAACANRMLDNIVDWPDDAPTAGDVYWEGPDEYCAECGTAIPSAYGEPEHVHSYGPVQHSRMAGTPHRACECGEVTLDLDDTDE